MNSEERKGVVARVRSWVQSCWLQPDGSTCQEYLFIAVVTLVFSSFPALSVFSPKARANAEPVLPIAMAIETLVLGLIIASFVKSAVWSERKLFSIREVLLQVALGKCYCDTIIVSADWYEVDYWAGKRPIEAEKIGKPLGEGCCNVCEARGVLEEHFPGAIEHRVREYGRHGVRSPEDLVKWFEAHQAKPQ